MGMFSKIKQGLSSRANAAIDKAVDPAKELEMAILELEEGRKKALAELVSYKASAKLMEADVARHRAKAADWERRAMLAVKAGEDDAARTALREKKACEVEAAKVERDKHEAAGYAIQLNKSRKEFETRLQLLKLRKGTLATQITAARSAGGDAFGNDPSVWDRFAAAEDRIDRQAIESEVDAAMRGEAADDAALEAKILKAGLAAGGTAGPPALPDGPGDALTQLKAQMATAKAGAPRALEVGPAAAGTGTPASPPGAKPGGTR